MKPDVPNRILVHMPGSVRLLLLGGGVALRGGPVGAHAARSVLSPPDRLVCRPRQSVAGLLRRPGAAAAAAPMAAGVGKKIDSWKPSNVSDTC